MTALRRQVAWYAVAAGVTLAAPATARQQPAGTAQLAGTVVTTDATPVPVRRAIVTLQSDAGWSGSAISDDAGRFAFANLTAGRYRLKAKRAGFVDAEHGARRPGRMGTQISLGAGQQLESVMLHMARGAVISGTVFGETGEPLAGVPILVTRPRDVPSLMAARDTRLVTDDRGQYRAFGLAPGEYLVAALPPSGMAGDLRASGSAEIDAILQELQRRGGGAAPPAPARTAPDATPESPSRVTYAPVYHPATHLRPQAAVIAVDAGDERPGIDIRLAPTPAVSLEGTVLHPGGQVQGVQLAISGAGTPVPMGMNVPVMSQRPGPDGRFRYTNVPPGRYTLTARVLQPEALFARAEIDVGGQDVTGLVLALQPALTFSGVIRFAGDGAPPIVELSKLRVVLQPASGPTGASVLNNTAFGQSFTASGQSDSAGAFEVRGILPGTYRTSITLPAPSGWWLRSAVAGGRDVLDEPLTFESTGVSGAVLTFTNQHSVLSGTLQTPDGQPAVDYHVVVISADRSHWLPGARRTRLTRPDSDGRFTFADLPAGSYLVVALDDVDPSELDDARYLAQLAPGGVPVTVADGASTVQDLRISVR
jgi:uncharacterized protein (DUF2141 family)